MKLLKKITRKNLSGLILLMIFLISASATAAQDKIVVIPLFDDQSVPRFIDNGDGTVTDALTNLIWLKNANCAIVKKTWSEALTFCNSLHDGWTGDGSGGDCRLSDGSSAGDWRLPNVRELHSLIDFSLNHPPLPTGHPFTGPITNDYYWSSTTYAPDISRAWVVRMTDWANMSAHPKIGSEYSSDHVWPVRGGN